MRGAYYNEHDAFAAAWLRELIREKLIADGEVDERSIELVSPDDLRGFVQCHFFAGIGGWSYALRLAGWPDDRPVWTGSCPCQPFSMAGKGEGADDPRHLWPTWFRLIAELRPSVLFGEQVASKDGLYWLDLVYADLEASGYAIGAADLCAAGVGAPHIRQRLWIVADSAIAGLEGAAATQLQGRSSRFTARRTDGELEHAKSEQVGLSRRARQPGSAAGELAHTDGRDTRSEGLQRRREHGQQPEDGGLGRSLADAESCTRRLSIRRFGEEEVSQSSWRGEAGKLGESNGKRETPLGSVSGRTGIESGRSPWSDAEWLPCRDGKSRPVEPTIFPLASGVSNRVGLLRGAGNAICPQVAQVFIEAYMSIQ